MKTYYGKLVRDRIPEIILAAGKSCEVKTLEAEDFLPALKAKLVEEAAEVNNSASREELIAELADLYEVLETLQAATGLSQVEIDAVKHQRRESRGGFEKRLYLEWVEESPVGSSSETEK